MLKALVATAVAALAIAGLALAAPQKDTYNLTANLRARSEVPRPTGVPVGATGLFTGKVVELANDKAKLSWRLTFSKLSGAAGAAHIHAGKVRQGRSGHGRALRPLQERPTRHRHDLARAAREDRSRRDLCERPHGEERRRRDPRADEGLRGRLAGAATRRARPRSPRAPGRLGSAPRGGRRSTRRRRPPRRSPASSARPGPSRRGSRRA